MTTFFGFLGLLISCILILIFLLKPQHFLFTYPLTTEPILNPLMGWAPWATIKKSQQPHSLVYADLTWREFEPTEGHFDFETFETKNQLTRWQEEGKRIVFRFVLDVPRSERHMDIPDWLFEKINGDGTFYQSEYGQGFSPNYENPIIIEYHKKAIHALGDAYGSTDFFAYIELGSLGHWGEWHIDDNANIPPLPDENIRNHYVLHYLRAFPHTHLLLRRPFNVAAQSDLGLFNDMTGNEESTLQWLDWIQFGGSYDQTDETNGLSPMPEAWKTAPIGGEQDPSLSDEMIYGENLQQSINLLRQSHTTFIGPSGPYDVPVNDPIQSGIDLALSSIGYRLFIKETKFHYHPIFSQKVKVEILFGNNGIAPLYYNWPTILYVFDNHGDLVYEQKLEIDLREILPGEFIPAITSIPFHPNLQNGIYTLGIGINDPITNQPAIQFAMRNKRDDLIFQLGSFEVR